VVRAGIASFNRRHDGDSLFDGKLVWVATIDSAVFDVNR
jgi:hypothetical protein